MLVRRKLLRVAATSPPPSWPAPKSLAEGERGARARRGRGAGGGDGERPRSRRTCRRIHSCLDSRPGARARQGGDALSRREVDALAYAPTTSGCRRGAEPANIDSIDADRLRGAAAESRVPRIIHGCPGPSAGLAGENFSPSGAERPSHQQRHAAGQGGLEAAAGRRRYAAAHDAARRRRGDARVSVSRRLRILQRVGRADAGTCAAVGRRPCATDTVMPSHCGPRGG